jgi:hypothetical protein
MWLHNTFFKGGGGVHETLYVNGEIIQENDTKNLAFSATNSR